MRLWHKDLINVLPKQQLVAQWRECCCIMKNIADNKTPNHLLVNRVMNYYPKEFYEYTRAIKDEMQKRGFKISQEAIKSFDENYDIGKKYFRKYSKRFANYIPYNVFAGWHNKRYFIQCYHNLEEKFDCCGITLAEWKLIQNEFINYTARKELKAE